jgi:hypothetical protein
MMKLKDGCPVQLRQRLVGPIPGRSFRQSGANRVARRREQLIGISNRPADTIDRLVKASQGTRALLSLGGHNRQSRFPRLRGAITHHPDILQLMAQQMIALNFHAALCRQNLDQIAVREPHRLFRSDVKQRSCR